MNKHIVANRAVMYLTFTKGRVVTQPYYLNYCSSEAWDKAKD